MAAAPAMAWRLRTDLREWQREAVAAWKAAGDRGVAAVVTGGGKTVLAYACILDLLERKPKTAVVILVPTVALLDQWFVGLGEDLGVAAGDIALFGGGRRPVRDRPINLMVINTGRAAAHADGMYRQHSAAPLHSGFGRPAGALLRV
jgi:superfamily II DNA or RNA helicase